MIVETGAQAAWQERGEVVGEHEERSMPLHGLVAVLRSRAGEQDHGRMGTVAFGQGQRAREPDRADRVNRERAFNCFRHIAAILDTRPNGQASEAGWGEWRNVGHTLYATSSCYRNFT